MAKSIINAVKFFEEVLHEKVQTFCDQSVSKARDAENMPSRISDWGAEADFDCNNNPDGPRQALTQSTTPLTVCCAQKR
ncbi:hypothetical protein FHS16_002475 [Paenibacillus endophyticus]|uniref:Uncharacterized protein n=1 Tax=Paenibacillus endophyticus TaxID=1294268 RepID=A0A7W5GA62_9BACL|nr:hypothetical protein [Paenibacillus endophyticus]MBB3152425.1 hypothetical protein [Paenibacillus endophyticus]